MHLQGKLVLITGASSGIGEAAARALARKGARVVLVARRADDLERVRKAIAEAGGEAHAYPADLGDEAAVETMAAGVREALGTPDVLINNAGAGRWLFLEETEPAEARQMMAAPFFAALFTTRAFLPAMLTRGSGLVVNLNSPVAFMPWQGCIGYASSRWALRGFNDALRMDLHGTGLKVVQVIPGKTTSSYFQTNVGAEERMPWIAKLIPTLTPEQVSEVLVRAIERESREIFHPPMLKAMQMATVYFPGIVERIVRSSGYKRGAHKPSS